MDNIDKEQKLLVAIDKIRRLAASSNSITTLKYLPAQSPVLEDYPSEVAPELVAGLKKKNFHYLYSHQKKAWEKVQAGKNVVIVTPTASGKTLCYNLPVLDRIIKEPSSRAIYLFRPRLFLRTSLLNWMKQLRWPGLVSKYLPMMEIRLRMPGELYVARVISLLPIPTCCTRAFSPTIPSGSSFLRILNMSSLMNFIIIAASLAAMWPMSSGG